MGGGNLEHKAMAIARDQLAAGAAGGELQRFPLGASLGQCCGGLVNLLFEPVDGKATWLDALAALRRRGEGAAIVTGADGGAKLGKVVLTPGGVTGSPRSRPDPR